MNDVDSQPARSCVDRRRRGRRRGRRAATGTSARGRRRGTRRPGRGGAQRYRRCGRARRCRAAAARCSTGTIRWCRARSSTSRARAPSWTWISCPSTPTARRRGRVDDQSAPRRASACAPLARRKGRSTTGFTAVGAVAVDERGIVAVQARSPGYVERLLVRAQYDGVAAGQPLAELYVPEWLAAQEELLALKAVTSRARPSSPTRRASGCAPRRAAAEIARVEREGKASARVTVTAPQVRHRLGDRRARRHGGDARHDAVQDRGHRHRMGHGRRAGGAGRAARASARRSKRARPRIPDRVFKGTVNSAAAGGQRADPHRARADRARQSRRRAEARDVRDGRVSAGRRRRTVLVPAEAVIRTGKRNVVVVDDGRGPLRAGRGRSRPRER